MSDHNERANDMFAVPGITTRDGKHFTVMQIQKALVDHDGNVTRAANALGVSRTTLREFVERSAAAGVRMNVETVTSVLPEHPKRDSIRSVKDIHDDHGVSMDDMELVSYTDNYWLGNDGEGPATLTQSKAVFKPRIPAETVIPYRPTGKTYKPGRKRSPSRGAPLLVALPSDQHCPHEDLALDSCWLQWLAVNQPGKIVGVGDLMNLSKPSRHRQNLGMKFNDDPQVCVDSGGDWWERVRSVCPDAECEQIPGNHDLRVQIATLERTPELYGLRRRGEDHPWYDLEYMLGLDHMGVRYHRPEGEYHSVSIEVAPNVMVAHGVKNGPYGGAPREAEKHENNRATGHGHKASITIKVRYRNGTAYQYMHLALPAMCVRDLGYQDDADTHQGFGALVVHDNGSVNLELATFDERTGTLVWRDQIYEA